ncbi:MAG: hypothetical protein GVY22_17475 [Gammaproteobacteria bacterium]|nr:hypothetical protein [Gammaproteobacteria bacterium]
MSSHRLVLLVVLLLGAAALAYNALSIVQGRSGLMLVSDEPRDHDRPAGALVQRPTPASARFRP